MPVIPGGTVELGYSPITSPVTINNGTAGTGVEVIAPLTVVTDGSPILVEFFSPEVRPHSAAGFEINVSLFEDGSEKIRSWGRHYNGTSTFDNKPMHLATRLTPSSGSHTYSVKAYVTNTTPATNTGFIGAGSGTTGSAACFLRVSKIVNQNDGLKPFWTPPVVTQLPSQATVGDQVIYAADATNGVYWHLQYDGFGTYPWKFIGGSPLFSFVATSESRSTASYGDLTTSGPSVSLPVPGDYMISHGCGMATANVTQVGAAMSYQIGASAATEAEAVSSQVVSPGFNYSLSKTMRKTGLSAVTLLAKYNSKNGVAVSFSDRFLSATPVRVSA